MKQIELYTDGACSGNPGPGGWACVLIYKESMKQFAGGESQTTNNRMELTAVIEGLKHLKETCQVHIFTDSKYVLEGATKWLDGWKKRGWKKADKKAVLNQDLWIALDVLRRYRFFRICPHPYASRFRELKFVSEHYIQQSTNSLLTQLHRE